MNSDNKSVTAHYRPLAKVTPVDIQQMYGIFRKYYANTSLEVFLADLSKKTGLFLIRCRDSRRIVGFSTVASLRLKHGNRTVRGVFSGDTIIEKEYWGSRALQKQFFVFMLRERVLHPFTPLFWLLISKGYKTYLLLANNFFRYHPHPDGHYGHYEPLVRQYCDTLFPNTYDGERRLLDFGDNYQKLRDDVADITADMRRGYPKIDFFQTRNPTWREGTELPCIGQAGYVDLLRYVFRFIGKLMRGKPVVSGAAISGTDVEGRQEDTPDELISRVNETASGQSTS
ncbi:MAG: hypothetical protein LAT61_12560 [Alcanivorax sp.]|nr:hypothetical protein [Alcanivorax sp.]